MLKEANSKYRGQNIVSTVCAEPRGFFGLAGGQGLDKGTACIKEADVVKPQVMGGLVCQAKKVDLDLT